VVVPEQEREGVEKVEGLMVECEHYAIYSTMIEPLGYYQHRLLSKEFSCDVLPTNTPVLVVK
jgi:hypothetical protein